MSNVCLHENCNNKLLATDKKARSLGLAFFLIIVIVFLSLYGGWLIRFPAGENVSAARQGQVMWVAMSGLTATCVLILRKLNKHAYIAALAPAVFILWLPVVYLQRMFLPFGFPGVDFLLPLLLYIIIANKMILCTRISWFRKGKFDRLSLGLIMVLCIISGFALWLWSLLRPDVVAEFLLMLPDMGWMGLLGAGVAFAFTNAFVEEALFRGAIRDGLLQFLTPRIEVFTTSLLFAVFHINGFPGGVLGVAMVFMWGVVLGIIRNRTGGLLGPFAAHVVADITIFILLAVKLM